MYVNAMGIDLPKLAVLPKDARVLTDEHIRILNLLVESGGEVHRISYAGRRLLEGLVTHGFVQSLPCECCMSRFRISEAGRRLLMNVRGR